MLLLRLRERSYHTLLDPAAAHYASAQPLGKRGVTDGSEGIKLFGSEAIKPAPRRHSLLAW